MFEFIQRYLGEHHLSPLIREIQDACQIASYKSAIDRLNALEHKRFIRRIPNKHRGIKLVRKVLPAPARVVEELSLAQAGDSVTV